MLLVLAYGFGGFIVSWAGLLPEETSSNLQFFRLFYSPHSGNIRGAALDNSSTGYTPQAWAGIAAVAAAATMSQAAVNALQSGLMGLVGSYLQDFPLMLTKLVTVAGSVLIMYCGTVLGDASKLLLLSQMVSCTSMVPMLLGMLSSLKYVYTGDMALSACLISFVTTSSYGIASKWKRGHALSSLGSGLAHAWYGNSYDWHYFAMAIGSSALACFACMLLGWLWVGVLHWPYWSASQYTARLLRDSAEHYWGADSSQHTGALPGDSSSDWRISASSITRAAAEVELPCSTNPFASDCHTLETLHALPDAALDSKGKGARKEGEDRHITFPEDSGGPGTPSGWCISRSITPTSECSDGDVEGSRDVDPRASVRHWVRLDD
jgi:hypothetical protein